MNLSHGQKLTVLYIFRCSDMTERSKSVSGNRIRIGMLKHKFLMDAGRTLPNV